MGQTNFYFVSSHYSAVCPQWIQLNFVFSADVRHGSIMEEVSLIQWNFNAYDNFGFQAFR